MNVSNILPEVFLNIIGLLEADKSRNGWNLSRSPNGKLSLSITHFPAKEHERSSVNQHLSLSGLVSQEQDTTASGHQIPPLRKRRKPQPRGGGPGRDSKSGSTRGRQTLELSRLQNLF